MLVFSDEQGCYNRAAVDSTPLIRELETPFPQRADYFSQRQKERLGTIIGSNKITDPLIEQSYQNILKLLEAHFNQRNFLSNSFFYKIDSRQGNKIKP